MDILSKDEACELGYSFYFTGVKCKRGHLSKRRVRNGDCVQCSNERSAKYRLENSDEFLEYLKTWRECNPDSNKVYYQKNADSLRESARIRARNSKDERAKAWQRWYTENREYAISRQSKRRSSIQGSGGSFTSEDVKRIIDLQKWRCAEPTCCADLTETAYHIDHIHPISKGGGNGPDNIQVLCKSCNLRKAALMPHEWARRMGRLI